MQFPEIHLQEDLEAIAEKIIIKDLIQGIDLSLAISGGALPFNDPKTILRKGSAKPLIDTGKLRLSFFHRVIGKNRVMVSIEGDRKEIGGYLQSGIKTRHGLKQYVFFGVSKDAEDSALKYMRDRIAEDIKNASTGSSKR